MSTRRTIGHALRAIETFTAPVALYALRFAFGRGWALVGTIAISVVVLGHQAVRHRVSPFAAIASGAAVLLGILGVVFTSDRFLQLEPAFHNAIAAIAVGATCLVGRPLLLEVARARVDPDRLESARPFATAATWAFAGLCALRAAGYAWIAAHGTLTDTVVARLVIGPASLALFAAVIVTVRSRKRRRS